MRINIKQTDCRFYVDEAARKVVCVIPDTKYLLDNYLDDFEAIARAIYADYKVRKQILLPNSFSGVATCHESDTFNVETGKLIAFNKAKYKLNTSFFKRANLVVNYVDRKLNETMDSFNDFGMRLSRNTDKREEEIERRLGVVENDG